jgi:hypothetical protein
LPFAGSAVTIAPFIPSFPKSFAEFHLKPEERARQKIDQLLEASGWIVQSREHLNLGSGKGIALPELPSPTGRPIIGCS